ncbi:MAG: MBL fold metallo-hydrolase [Thermodesulfobacteriota bacterium]|nr:MBL fold metallo-hydrolase [Thermodesulfobacteriota bacterium]
MYFSVLGSGSRGNSLYIESGQTSILIDAGFSGKELARRLAVHGREMDELDGLFLTHEHNDHIQGAGVISRRCRLPVYANEGTFQGSDKKLGKLHKRVEFETGKGVALKDLEVRSFAISHDTRDPVGYLISDGRVSVACCTDTGKVSHLIARRLSSCDAVVLEFNHDPMMLKNGPYPLFLQQRVRSSQGHLANEDAASFLQDLLHEKLRYVILAHLSEKNNRPELALKSAAAVMCDGHQCELHVAAQNNPTNLFIL